VFCVENDVKFLKRFNQLQNEIVPHFTPCHSFIPVMQTTEGFSSLENLETIKFEDIEFHEQIGKGAFGVVTFFIFF
jgi:hypothetical protein